MRHHADKGAHRNEASRKLRSLNLPHRIGVRTDGHGRPSLIYPNRELESRNFPSRESANRTRRGDGRHRQRDTRLRREGDPQRRGNARERPEEGPRRRRERTPPGPYRVASILEEWRIDDEWWRTPISRRYVTLVLENGRTVTIYEDLVEGGWYRQNDA